MATSITWDSADFTYDNAPTDSNETRYTWDDVKLVDEVLKRLQQQGVKRGGPAGDDFIHPFFDDEKKNKRLIKLIYKTQGKILKEEKEIKEIKVTVKDVKILAKEVLGINVKIL